MAPSQKTAIQPTRAENYPEWYQQVIKAADLAEHSPVRGCMVIKPWGYSLWENMQADLDRRFKETGHENAYFPLFIPKSYLEREAEHIEGFAKECAVVTHSRLEANEEGELIPTGELDEPLIVRPTSETIIGEMYSRWVQSYRDLPILINQWANVVRWEMRTRLFLRTAEFLWQEGHTLHATREEALAETRRMLEVYRAFAEEAMAMPVLRGEKTAAERFPGADATYCIEALMQDRKALQAGTSHFLGQNFARASDITFLSKEGREELAWSTSWGTSTRLVGAMIMVHSDDNGLVLPPRLAPLHAVLLPVVPKEEQRSAVEARAAALRDELAGIPYAGGRLRLRLDDRDLRGGEKNWGWVKKGVPLRLELGPRDLENGVVAVSRRDRDPREKESIPFGELATRLPALLEEIQENLRANALAFRREHTHTLRTREEFEEFFGAEEAPGLALLPWGGSEEEERAIAQRTKATIRCIPFEDEEGAGWGTCPFTGREARIAVFGRAY
jgi:prolyl-tRNA synthetase